uniref:hypothetical protein n=1 Tax=Escherichia coli TaxID=562 RepID=UPI00200CEDDB
SLSNKHPRCTTSENMSGLSKTTVLLLLVVCVMALTVTFSCAERVAPCDIVCGRTETERNSCCRAHGYSFYIHCEDGLHCQ